MEYYGPPTTDHRRWKRISWILCLWSTVCGLWSGCVIAENVSRVCFQEHCFTVEIADEPSEQQRGLMFREELSKDHGMLFVFDRDLRYSFWMKNTLIPLDMIWLDRDLRVVHIEENVPPCEEDPCPSYKSSVPACYVLELNAGTASEVGLAVGDALLLNNQ